MAAKSKIKTTIGVNGGPAQKVDLSNVAPFQGRADRRQAEAFSPGETGESIAADELKAFIERIERLDEEISSIRDDRRDVVKEVKGRGFSTKAILQIVRLRKQDPHERAEEEAILELYLSAIGMA